MDCFLFSHKKINPGQTFGTGCRVSSMPFQSLYTLLLHNLQCQGGLCINKWYKVAEVHLIFRATSEIVENLFLIPRSKNKNKNKK